MHKKAIGQKIRQEFPIFLNNMRLVDGVQQPFCYLDSAATTQKPQSVIQAMSDYLQRDYGSVHRGAYRVSSRSSELYEETREIVARFLGKSVKPSQIVFTHGTTEGLNILANGFAQTVLDEKARIVIPALEHHANLVPWQQAALRRDCEIAYIPLDKEKRQLNLESAKKLITKNTKVVSLAFVGNVLGQINPVEEIIALAKSQGAYVVLDCAQSISSITTDAFALGADAVVFSGHKVYGPSGIGVLALSEELVALLPPLIFGGGMIDSVTLEESVWKQGVAKFEAGTPPVTEVIGLGVALNWIEDLNRERVHKHVSALAREFLQGLKKLENYEVFSPGTGRESIIAFRHKYLHAHDIATILDTENVAMRAGNHCAWPLIQALGVEGLVRASFALYSDFDDVEIALGALAKADNMWKS